MNKLIKVICSLVLLITPTIAVVSCNSGSLIKEPELNKDKKQFELFGEAFESREDAINYYLDLDNGLQISSESDYFSEIFLGESKHNSSEDVLEYIDSNYPIKELKTNKNIDDFVIDGMNQLSSTVVKNENDEIYVYKDADGKVVYEQDAIKAKEIVEKTYYNKIQSNFYVEDKFYNNISEAKEHYYKNFINNSEQGGIEKEELFTIGSASYNKKEVEREIANSIRTTYLYNNQKIKDFDLYTKNSFNPSTEDKNRIQKYSKSPGKFLIETKGSKGGQFTGDKVITSQSDLNTYFYDEKNWTLASKTSKNLMEITQSLMSDTLMSSVNLLEKFKTNVENNKDFNKLDYCFPSNGKISGESIFNCFSDESTYKQFSNLVEKYELVSESEYILSEINSLTTIEFIQKAVIYLYQIADTFRFSQISVKDSDLLNELMYEVIVNITSEIKEWKVFVDSLGKNNVLMALDFLIEKNDFFEKLNYIENTSVIQKNINSLNDALSNSFTQNLMLKAIDETEKLLIKHATQIATQLTNELNKVVQKAVSAVPIIGDIFDFINSISLQKTLVYELIIPDTKQKLSYSITAWQWEKVKFNPEEIFKVFSIKKPRDNEVYQLGNRSFSSKETANDYLIRVLIDEMIESNNVIYESDYFSGIQLSDKKELIEYLTNKTLTENKVNYSAYSDHFGGIHSNVRDALEAMEEKLKDPNNLTRYHYYNFGTGANSNSSFYTKDYEEMILFIDNQIKDFEMKLVSSSDLSKETNFDELYDLSKFEKPIYTFNLYGMDYFYKDKVNATYAIMKLLNYKSTTIETTVEKYIFNDTIFENKILFIEYLNVNIKEINVSKGVKNYA
ncbi:hypothetical protein [Spiroplasma endosymbiont of Cantharis rufa]|uniref:hypothetical protein n=1 Tax=Spiroplasma endosymbiont of Cantharis rufa TaxID=3066279 RepID=UPI0030D5B0E8